MQPLLRIDFNILLVISILVCLILSINADIDSIPFTAFDALPRRLQDDFIPSSPSGVFVHRVPTAHSELEMSNLSELSLHSLIPVALSEASPFTSAFQLPDTTFVPVSKTPSIFELILQPFASLHLTVVSTSPFSVLTSNDFGRYSIGTNVYQCELRSPSQLAASRTKLTALKQTQRYQSLSASNDGPMVALDHYTMYEAQLLSAEELPYQCQVEVSLYGYYWPFTKGYVGFHAPETGIESLSGTLKSFLLPNSASGSSRVVFVAFKRSTLNISSFIVLILSAILFRAAPQLVSSPFIHLSIGTALGCISILAIVSYIVYKISPMRRVTVPLIVTAGYFGHADTFLKSIARKLLERYPMQILIVAVVGGLVGCLVTMKWFSFDSAYSSSVSAWLRLLILLVWAVLFQNIISLVLFSSILLWDMFSHLPSTTQPEKNAKLQQQQQQNQSFQGPRQNNGSFGTSNGQPTDSLQYQPQNQRQQSSFDTDSYHQQQPTSSSPRHRSFGLSLAPTPMKRALSHTRVSAQPESKSASTIRNAQPRLPPAPVWADRPVHCLSYKLFNTDPLVSADEICQEFAIYDQGVSVEFGPDSASARDCWVDFSTAQSMRQALAMHGQYIGRNPVVLTFSSD